MNFNGLVLLVDDEPHIRKFVSLILKQLGVSRVVEAADGEEALAVFERDKPALVLLDVNMPKVDGLETLRRLRKIDPECVVIMLTSLANRATVDAALADGAANYILKDTPKNEIAAALAATIDAAFEQESAS